jgi:DNA polymerase V
LEEAVATYTMRAAEKLRSQGSVAGYISVFIHTNQFKKDEPQYANSASRTIGFPTAFTPDLIGYALKLLRSIYLQGYKYRKAGVYLTKITPQEHVQFDLFGEFALWQHDRQRWLMEAVDRINRLWGHDTIFFGAQGIRREWQMRQEKRSPRYTTRWDGNLAKSCLTLVCSNSWNKNPDRPEEDLCIWVSHTFLQTGCSKKRKMVRYCTFCRCASGNVIIT